MFTQPGKVWHWPDTNLKIFNDDVTHPPDQKKVKHNECDNLDMKVGASANIPDTMTPLVLLFHPVIKAKL